jgi:hypothetical protein
LPQRSVPVPNAKEPDPKNGDGFSKVEPELESFISSKWEIKKKKKERIFCHNILVFLDICQISRIIQIILNSDFSLLGNFFLLFFKLCKTCRHLMLNPSWDYPNEGRCKTKVTFVPRKI